MVEKIIKKSGNATITSRSQSPTPRGREEGKNLNVCKITHAFKAHRQTLSSPSEVITMQNGLKNKHENSKARLNEKRPVVKTTKPHKVKIITGLPP